MRKDMDNWIVTEGSPFVIIESTFAEQWDGADNYNTVCSVQDYLGIISMNNHTVLVLGDEPMAARIVKKDSEVLILRWKYAPSCEAVEDILNGDMPVTLEPIEEIEAEFTTNEVVMFDSLYRVNEAPAKVSFTLPGKRCYIKTCNYKNEDVSLIVHIIQCL